MRIFFNHVTLRIQKQNAPPITQTKIQTFLNKQESDYRFVFMNKMGDVMPSKTSNHCWWCRNPFETEPLGIPLSMDQDNKSYVFEMEGIFCSYECCHSFLKDNSKSCTLLNYNQSLYLLHKLYELTGHSTPLKEAPDWKLLEIVGTGSLTIKQFRSNLASFIRVPNITLVAQSSKYLISKN